MTVRNIKKNLAGAEDLLHGIGLESQVRGGAVYDMHKLDTYVPTYDITEMQKSSLTFMRLYGDDTHYTDYRRNPAGTVGIPSDLGGVWEPIKTSELQVVGNSLYGAYVYGVDQVMCHAGTLYSWSGSFPKVVSAGSTPATSGGIAAGAWVDMTDATLRGELKHPPRFFNTATEMVLNSGLLGQQAETLGFYSVGDGGGAKYLYTSATADGMLNLSCAGGVTATLQHGGKILLKQIGAIADFSTTSLNGTDVSPYINTAFSVADAVKVDGHYALKSPLSVPKHKMLCGYIDFMPIRESTADPHGISTGQPQCSLQVMMPNESTDNAISVGLYASVKNLMICHPLQSAPPRAMAPTIYAPSLGAAIENVQLNSSWTGIKVKGNGNVKIHNIYGTALGGGLIDMEQSGEVCDISNIHAWKWWAFSGWEDWSLHNGVVIRLGNVDGANIRGVFGLSCKHVIETYLASGLTANAVNNYAWANISQVVADISRVPVKIFGASQLSISDITVVANPIDIQGSSCIVVDGMPEKGIVSINGVNGYNAGYLIKITNDPSVYGGNIAINGNARIGTAAPSGAGSIDTSGISTLAILNQSNNLHVRVGALGCGALSAKQSIAGKNVWIADVNSQQQTTGTSIPDMNSAANWTGATSKFSFTDEGIYSNDAVAGVNEIRFLLPANIKVLSLDCLCGWLGIDAASLSSMLYGIDVVENNLVTRAGALWPVANWPKVGVNSRFYKEFTLDPAKRYQIRYRFNQGGLSSQFLTNFSGYYTV